MRDTRDEPTAIDASIAALEFQLVAAGLHGALAFLNGRTRHRYTGTYLFDPPKLRNHCLFDRENPEVRSMNDLLLRDSYCGIVGEHNEPFGTDDSLSDSRLEGHPSRHSIFAYRGFPLRDDTGVCFGTLCHWDVRPRIMPIAEIPLFLAAAPVLARRVLTELGRLND